MEKIYKYNFETNYLNFDAANHLKLKCILECCQQAAVLHACDLGLDPKRMAERKKFWVINKLKIEFLDDINLFDKVLMKSFMLQPTGSFTLQREYVFSVKGKDKVVGTSKWCLIDTEKNNLAHFDTIKDIMPSKLPTKKLHAIEYSKVMIDENFEKHHTRKILFNDLDINNHCNNQKYIEMAINAIPHEWVQKSYKSFEINYLKQCYFDEEIVVYRKIENNELSVIGKVKDEIRFSARIIIK